MAWGRGAALAVADADEGDVGEGVEDGLELVEVEAAVHGGDEGGALASEEAEGPVVHVEVHDVEVVGLAACGFHEEHVGGDGVADGGVEAEGAGPDGFEAGGGDAVAAGEEGDVVAHGDEFLGEEGDDAFGAAVELGGTASWRGAIWAIRIWALRTMGSMDALTRGSGATMRQCTIRFVTGDYTCVMPCYGVIRG